MHQVNAKRAGDAAHLQCGVCQASATVPDGDFEKLNDFVAEHRDCAE